MKAEVPAGLWAVADGLAAAEDSDRWLETCPGAAARTFRRPAAGDAAALTALRRLCATGSWTAVHARGDLAAAADAHAVIAGARSLPPAVLRGIFPGLQLGVSVHDAAQLDAAGEAGADFVIFGPVWNTPSKSGVLEPRGLGGLSAAAAGRLPVVAIGGVEDPDRVRACHAAGARACAALRAARHAPTFAALVEAWDAVAG